MSSRRRFGTLRLKRNEMIPPVGGDHLGGSVRMVEKEAPPSQKRAGRSMRAGGADKLRSLLGEADIYIDPRQSMRLNIFKAGWFIPDNLDKDAGAIEAFDYYAEQPQVEAAHPPLKLVVSKSRESVRRRTVAVKMLRLKLESTALQERPELVVAYFSLYDKATKTYISEEAVIPLHALNTTNLEWVFGDLTNVEMSNALLVCRMYRLTTVKPEDPTRRTSIVASPSAGGPIVLKPFACCVWDGSMLLSDAPVRGRSPLYCAATEAQFAKLPEQIFTDPSDLVRMDDEQVTIIASYGERGEQVPIIRSIHLPRMGVEEPFHRLLLTIHWGKFAKGKKSAPRNIQIRAMICDLNGVSLDATGERGTIIGNPGSFVSSCSTSVIYHSNNPTFNEMLTLPLPPPENLDQYHVYIEISHCSSKGEEPEPFSFTFFQLYDVDKHNIAPDDTYTLRCFKYKHRDNFKNGTANIDEASIGQMSQDPKVQKRSRSAFSTLRGNFKANSLSNRSSGISVSSTQDMGSVDLSEYSMTIDENVILEEENPANEAIKKAQNSVYFLKLSGDEIMVTSRITSHLVSHNEVILDMSRWSRLSEAKVKRLLGALETLTNQEVEDHLQMLVSSLLELLESGMFGDEAFNSLLRVLSRVPYEAGEDVINRVDVPGIHLIVLDHICSAFEKTDPDTELRYWKQLIKSLGLLVELSLASLEDDEDEDVKAMMQRLLTNLYVLVSDNGYHLEADDDNLIEIFFANFIRILNNLQTYWDSSDIASSIIDFSKAVQKFNHKVQMEKLGMWVSIFKHDLSHFSSFMDKVVRYFMDTIETQFTETLEERILAAHVLLRSMKYLGPEKCASEENIAIFQSNLKFMSNTMHQLLEKLAESDDGMYGGVKFPLQIVRESEPTILSPTSYAGQVLLSDRSVASCALCFIQTLLYCPDDFSDGLFEAVRRSYSLVSRLSSMAYGAMDLESSLDLKRLTSGPERNSSPVTPADQNLDNMLDVCIVMIRKSILAPGDFWILLRKHEVQMVQKVLRYVADQFYTIRRASTIRKFWQLQFDFLSCRTFKNLKVQEYILEEGISPCIEVARIAEGLFEKTLRFDEFDFAAIAVPACLKLCFEETEPEIQRIARKLYIGLLINDMQVSSSLEIMENLTINAIDEYTSVRKNELVACQKDVVREIEALKQIGLDISGEQFDDSANYQSSIIVFISTIEDQFNQLFALYSLREGEDNEDQHVDATVNLIALMKSSPSQRDLYDRYLLRLANIHIGLKNFVQVGAVLEEYANSLEWSMDTSMPALRDYPPESSYDRKCRVCKEAIYYYLQSNTWERCCRLYSEVAHAEETIAFNYSKAAGNLTVHAQLLEKISNDSRIFHNYYRVSFSGNGFPTSLRNKAFIYQSGRGVVLQSVLEFTNNIKGQYPDAIVTNMNAKDPITDRDGKFINIITVKPSSEDELQGHTNPFMKKQVPYKIKAYYMHNEVDVFTYTRVLKTNVPELDLDIRNEFSGLWVERVFMKTQNKLPGVSRRSGIDNETVQMVSPLENAVSSILAKTADIWVTIQQFQDNRDADVGPISMVLNGVIDAAVQGGVKKYQEAFFESNYLQLWPADAQLGQHFRSALESQIAALEFGLKLFDQHCEPSLQPLVEHLLGKLEEMKEQSKSDNFNQ